MSQTSYENLVKPIHERLQRILGNPWIPHKPTAKQAAYLLAVQREALFGGAAGGGKSDALLMAALEHVDHPKYSAILFRRTYPQLESTLIERSRQWLQGTAARYDEQQHLWRFPSGARLKFAHLNTDKDRFDHQSAEYQFIGYDELTQFSEVQYVYLISRLRRTVDQLDLPLRMRSGSNPGGEGHEWVKARFVSNDKDEPVEHHNRIFIPALLQDNPFIDQSEYIQALGELDPVTKAQLLRGDWTAKYSAGFIDVTKMEIVDSAPTSGWYRWIRYWDLAATEAKPGKDPDWTAGALWGKNTDGFYYLLDVARWQKGPADTEYKIKGIRQLDPPGAEIHMEQEPGSSGKIVTAYFRRQLDNAAFYADPVTGKKIERAKILSAQVESGRVRVVRGDWNRAFFNECDSFPTVGVHDDQVDAASGGIAKLITPNALEYLQQELQRQKEAEEKARAGTQP